MTAARLIGWLGLPLLLLLSACPQGTPEQPGVRHPGAPQSDSASPRNQPAPNPARETAPPAPVAYDATADVKRPQRRVRTGGPLPPQRMPEPVALDRHCKIDADCTVKDVGNCCGAYPACVNADSPTAPKAVQAQCAREGKSSACGFREVSACKCVRGICLASTPALDPPVDPAPHPPEER